MGASTSTECSTSPPTDSSSSSSPSSSSQSLRSRLNFVTFDRLLHMDLTKDWPKPEDSTGAAWRKSLVEATQASQLSLHRITGEATDSLPRTTSLSSTSSTTAALGVHLVEDLLSSDECNHLILQTRRQDSLQGEYLSHQRDSTRLLVQSPQLASLLWDRFAKLLPEIIRRHPTALVPMGFGTFGSWEPFAVNSCMRFSDYLPGSTGFKPHRDSSLVQSTCERSVLTLLVYLNDIGPTTVKNFTEPAYSGRGCTSFYRSTKFVAGGLVSEEHPAYCFSIKPKAGRAVLFPHETLHAGDPISMYYFSKHILRTDIVFRRWENVPLLPVETNWRNLPEYLRAVELFQRAFKLELAGDVQQASDCYERCTNLRVAALLQRRSSLMNLASKQLQGVTAATLAHDCLRLIFQFLQRKELGAVVCVCRSWRQALPKQFNTLHCSAVIPSLFPAQPPEVISRYHYRNSADIFKSFLPTLHSHHVNGITIIMSYPMRFYQAHESSCRRAMAVYAATMFSHALPLIERTAPASAGPDSHIHTALPKDEKKMLDLAAIRIVLSYQHHPSNVISPSASSQVEWCTFEELLVHAVKRQQFQARLGTLSEFNSDNSDDAATSDNRRQRRFFYGEKEADLESLYRRQRRRFTVSFADLLPTRFYHAAVCSYHETDSTKCEPTRYSEWCILRFQQEKAPRRMQRAAEYKRRDAQELRCLDEATVSQISKIATKSESKSATDSLVTVSVQEMRTSKKIAYFRVSFIGIPAL